MRRRLLVLAMGLWPMIAATSGPEGPRFLCPPEPQPTRDQAVQLWIAWAQQHPQCLGERPVDNIFQFAAAQWWCFEAA